MIDNNPNSKEVGRMGAAKIQRRIIAANGLNIFYLDTASDKQPMLCLHGRWGRGETWTDLMCRCGDRYRIIAPDQRGHGLSDKPIARYAAADFVADMHDLLTKLACGPVIAVGHSMGGSMAANLTVTHPDMVTALAILDETAAGRDRPSNLPPEDIAADDGLTTDWPTPYPTYEDAVRDLRSRFGRETNVRYFLDSLAETAEGYDYLFSRRAMSAIREYSQGWFDLLPKIQCPVLLVRAAESWSLSREDADKMVRLIKDCTYAEVTDSDHMVYADNPEEFYPPFEEFIRRVTG
jgi:2-succinyl-6-hydroxy-2,4-cyclohexadiene-1-carboxylate synthase